MGLVKGSYDVTVTYVRELESLEFLVEFDILMFMGLVLGSYVSV